MNSDFAFVTGLIALLVGASCYGVFKLAKQPTPEQKRAQLLDVARHSLIDAEHAAEDYAALVPKLRTRIARLEAEVAAAPQPLVVANFLNRIEAAR